MAKKTHDLAVKVGTYEKEGQIRNRYENVGIIMAGDNGGRFILLKKTFNPAGVETDGKDTVLISAFAVDKPEGDKGVEDDDIPF
jgi:hypothetical protein